MNISNKNYKTLKNSSRFMNNTMKSFMLVSIVLFAIEFSAQTTRYVDPTGADSGNCTDPSNACATIDYAMDMAGSGDLIDIASGVYTEQLIIDKDLTIQGAGNTQPGGTIIQANAQPGQATGSVITIDGTYSIQISGVTIRHGVDFIGGGLNNKHANLTLTAVTFTENTADFGGGMYNDSGNITLTNVNFTNNTSVESGGGLNNYSPNEVVVLNDVVFTENTAGHAAGGVALYGGDTFFTNVTFDNNNAENSDSGGLFVSNTIATFTDLSFTGNETLGGGYGGAVYIEESTVDFVNTSFTGNTVALNDAGAVYSDSSILSFTNSTFTGNEAAQVGGALYAFDSDITLLDVLFEDNSAEIGGGVIVSSGNNHTAVIQNAHFKNNEATGDFGGGFANEGGIATLVNTLFTGNKVSGAGGAIVNAGELHLINSTITQNEGTLIGAGGIYNLMGNLTMTNSIVWGNTGPEGPDIANIDEFTASYSLYDDSDLYNVGNFNCANCLTVNPEFADAPGSDFGLTANSPALDAGDPNTDISEFPINGNNNPIDLAGNARVFNNIIDMGAYEFNTLSNQDFNDADFQVVIYPNPVETHLHIETEQDIQSVTIYSVTGQHIQTVEHQSSINLSTYARGIYLVKITTQNSSTLKQVVKK